MSVKDYNKCIEIIDATTGNIIDTIMVRNYSIDTIQNMLNDIIYNDYIDNQHGLLIKYGIKP